MRIFNSISRQVEKFESLSQPKVGVYACGPTVYDYATIGNWRTYILSDTLLRTLNFLKYEVDFIMNLTDVGHLTGDNLGDADTGEDRLEKTARKEKKTAWDVAKFYGEEFQKEFDRLNLIRPRKFVKATNHIEEQIEMIGEIEKVGYSYKTKDGIYFDVGKYENDGNKYGDLSDLDQLKEGARVEKNPEKRDPRDFALWKFSPEGKKRDMEWSSPWGLGFPGWHIECSAMGVKYLGKQFNIHVGGEDLRSTHHPNEIAQSEAATGNKPFVKYWVHGAFLLVDGGRMGKSKGNAYTLADIEKKGFSPLDLRYFYLTAHYRKQQNFTWEALLAARNARNKLRREVQSSKFKVQSSNVGCAEYEERFREAVSNDLNMPEALAVVWDLVKADLPGSAKLASIFRFDEVLGLKLGEESQNHEITKSQIPEEVKEMVRSREKLRKKGRWEEADDVRKKIEERGFKIEDASDGTKIVMGH